MKTLRLIVDPKHLSSEAAQDAIRQAAEILRRGGLVAFPTETVYGVGANALDAGAIARIFAAKQRPKWDPVIVHVAEKPMLESLVTEIPERARQLVDSFWPGPLTLLLPRSSAIPDAVTAGRPLVGMRMPSHPVALELIRQAGIPVAAPSANRFGHTSPTTAEHVLEDLDGRIDAVLDGGATEHGVESTVLDPCQSPMIIYRPGAVTAHQIREAAGPVEFYRKPGPLRDAPQEALPSPGVGLRHYAPAATLVLLEGSIEEIQVKLARAVQQAPSEQIGIMLPKEMTAPSGVTAVWDWGRWAAPRELARKLYAGLRKLDAQGCTLILCPLPGADGIGAAIRDRLGKAAKKQEAKDERVPKI